MLVFVLLSLDLPDLKMHVNSGYQLLFNLRQLRQMRRKKPNIQVIRNCEQRRSVALCLLTTPTTHAILNLKIVPIFIAHGAFFTLDLRQSPIEIGDVAPMLFRYSRLLETVPSRSCSCSLSRVGVQNRGWWIPNSSSGTPNSSSGTLNSSSGTPNSSSGTPNRCLCMLFRLLRIGWRWSRLLTMPSMIACTSLLGSSSTAISTDLCRFHLMTIVGNIEVKLPKCLACSFCRRWIAFICYTCTTMRALVLFLVTRSA